MRRPLQFRFRTMIVAVAVVSLLLAYVGSYYRLSRRGLSEAVPYEMEGFLYVPIENFQTIDKQVIYKHYRLMMFYAPANWIDRQFFHKNQPVTCFLRLTG